MALTSQEQELFDFALAGLPSWFQDDRRAMEFIGGCAKLFGAVRAQVDYWNSQTLIGSAVGPATGLPDWLGQHADDRDTRRQGSEGDPALRARLKNVPDALTRSSLLAAAQAIVDASGVVGDVAILEPMRYWRGFLLVNQGNSGVGGTFAINAGVVSFAPDVAFARPPLKTFDPIRTWKITLTGAAHSGNNTGVSPKAITGLDGDAAIYVNGSAFAEHDASVAWRVDRYDADDVLLTGGPGHTAGRLDAYCDRGFRMGADRSAILLILPYGTTEGTRLAVLEMLRQKKAAGIGTLVERRENP